MTEQEKQELFDRIDRFAQHIEDNDNDPGYIYGASEMGEFVKLVLGGSGEPSHYIDEFFKRETAVT